ncbi:PAS domain S-box protein [Desulfonatronovibrio magnus]|uniref:PAS domain S-box protein n=1 Tax=Desulfonatronovibrio magnus TaxID=698827 RepID=UPI000696C9C2|nr:PAS domain S-box protein [Desulfonatronovibrio magnus]
MLRKKLLLSLVLFSLIVFCTFQFAFLYFEKRNENALQQALTSIVSAYAQNLHLRLTDGLSALNTLESILFMEEYRPDQFNYWGGVILEANPSVSAVQLAPDGVVSYIVPLQGNEGAIGHDLFADPRRAIGAKKAVETRSITFIGPVRLIQSGEMAVIARKPVFRTVEDEETFWGFVIVLIEVGGLIPREMDLSHDHSVAWRLLGDDPDMGQEGGRPLIAESDDAPVVTQWDISYDIAVPNGTWQMQIASDEALKSGFALRQGVVILLTALFAAFFAMQQTKVIRRNEQIKAGERQAKQEREQFLSILNSIPEIIYVSDFDTHEIFFANQKMKELIGRDIAGEQCFKAVRGKDEECRDCTKKMLSLSGEPSFSEEYLSNFDKHFYVMNRTIQWTSAKKARFQLAIDITQRKQFEEDLKASEERFRLAFAHANDGVCIVGLDGRFLQVNQRMSEIFGYSIEELESMTVNDLAHPEDVNVSPKFIQRSLSGEVSSSVFEKRYIHKNGDVIWGQVSSSIIRNYQEEPLHFVSHVQDITEKKQLEELKADVDRIMRHDLKTPLNGIIGLPEIMKMEGGLSEDQISLLDLIEKTGQDMLHMIDFSLDFFKMETGRYDYVPLAVDALEVLENISGQKKSQMNARKLSLEITVDGVPLEHGAKLYVPSQRRLLFSMLGNLVTNAIEASPDGGRITINLHKGDPTTIAIGNKGAVPEHIRNSFFQKYSTFGKKRGTGLGTYSAKVIADAMGYDVQMQTWDEEDMTEVRVVIPNSMH